MEHDADDQTEIPTYLSQAVLATILCCPATGFPALIQATRVQSLLEAGDREGALRASRAARRLILWSCVLGAILILSTIGGAVVLGLFLRDTLVQQIEAGAL